MRATTIRLALLALLAACPAPRPQTTAETTPAAGVSTAAPAPELEPLRRAFPLGDGEGRVLTFAVTEGETAHPDYVLALSPTGVDRGVVLDGGRSSAVVIDKAGVSTAGFVQLKLPLTAGAAWQTSTAGVPLHVSIEAVDETVTVPAGTYPSCVRTLATGAPGSVATVYCDGVGPVLFELTSPRGTRRMALRSVAKAPALAGDAPDAPAPTAPDAPDAPGGLE